MVLGQHGELTFAGQKWKFSVDSGKMKVDTGQGIIVYDMVQTETGNMIINAEMKLKASLLRKESRCSHFRLDYPEIDTKNWNVWINIYKDRGGEITLEKQPFGTWPDQGHCHN